MTVEESNRGLESSPDPLSMSGSSSISKSSSVGFGEELIKDTSIYIVEIILAQVLEVLEMVAAEMLSTNADSDGEAVWSAEKYISYDYIIIILCDSVLVSCSELTRNI